jgi:penicillin-binding protein 2
MKNTNNIRLWILKGITALLFGLLAGRLVHLQIIHGEKYLETSEENRIRALEIEPARGKIYDRHGDLLVDNRPSFSIFVIPYEIKKRPETIGQLIELIGLDPKEVREKLTRQKSQPFQPLRIARDVVFAKVAALEERMDDFPGVLIRIETERTYPLAIAPHVIGYLGELTKTNPEDYPGLQVGDIVGKTGIELQYDAMLRGKKGVSYIQVDALGRELGEVYPEKAIAPTAGTDIYLTLDLHLMQFADSLLGDRSGSVVALDPNTGEIYVLLSKPRYDLEMFSGGITQELWKQLQDDPNKPLLHRALQACYPPGSTLKMAILAAGLESGAFGENYTAYCPGSFRLGVKSYGCWKEGGHGTVGILRSLEESCDVFYYNAGLAAGLDAIESSLKKFQFGRPTGIDLDFEASGLVPGRAYYDKRYGKRGWTKGLIPNISIGQGEVLVTPIQMAQYVGIIATRGHCPEPHLLGGFKPVDWKPFPERDLPSVTVELQDQTWALIQEGMRRVMMGDHGTAHWLMPKFPMAGKTGTAQNPHGEDHAWFVCFAPFGDPKIAVSVLVENGGHGSSVAAPVAVKLIEEFLRLYPSGELLANK